MLAAFRYPNLSETTNGPKKGMQGVLTGTRAYFIMQKNS